MFGFVIMEIRPIVKYIEGINKRFKKCDINSSNIAIRMKNNF